MEWKKHINRQFRGETQMFNKYAKLMFNLTSNFRNANLNEILHYTQKKGKKQKIPNIGEDIGKWEPT